MAVFTLEYTNYLLSILNEKKTREEYARRAIKKKYNFVPDKPSENNHIGTITTDDGKKYRLDMDKDSRMKLASGKVAQRITSSNTNDKDSTIYLDKRLFNVKGSNHGERRNAILNHEIGHQNLHNTNPNNKTVEDRNRNVEVFKQKIHDQVKSDEGKDLDTASNKEDRYEEKGIKKYEASVKATDEEKEKREKALKAAKHYEDKSSNHASPTEFEADRFAANRTSDSAVKKGLRNYYKNERKYIENEKYKSEKDPNKKADKISTDIQEIEKDEKARNKALKDDTLKKSDVYK